MPIRPFSVVSSRQICMDAGDNFMDEDSGCPGRIFWVAAADHGTVENHWIETKQGCKQIESVLGQCDFVREVLNIIDYFLIGILTSEVATCQMKFRHAKNQRDDDIKHKSLAARIPRSIVGTCHLDPPPSCPLITDLTPKGLIAEDFSEPLGMAIRSDNAMLRASHGDHPD
ncbi:hypothetical protein SISNIDRAFT_494528 [Sistotremastrum niveocremeum HHB9708]|uniref:Uncharacterized protein n=1 Tax=Sistotremastrum niveocremeum HHB9708 TaxID=1314777 RepID=A0A164WJZ0_9AGAM|nr:hypothetical protein SISNIDRAFT_494528 [Sistotremastrum niveocremeum HHB9708]